MRGPLGDLLDGNFAIFFATVIVLILGIALHEFGHAFSADVQGDRTARLAGRLTINPLAHLDPLGSFMLLFAGFGWGKPVPFSPRGLRSARFGSAMVAIAGPIVNVILAFIFAAAFAATLPADGTFLRALFLIGVQLNIVLAVFNMIPVPPLDGSRILGAVLPPSKQHIIFFLDKWGFIILLLGVFFIFPRVLGPIVANLSNRLLNLFL